MNVDSNTLRHAAGAYRLLRHLDTAWALDDHDRLEALFAGVDPVDCAERAGMFALLADIQDSQDSAHDQGPAPQAGPPAPLLSAGRAAETGAGGALAGAAAPAQPDR